MEVKILYILVDMGQRKSRQLSVHLLEHILITKGGRVEQKLMQRYFEFVDIVNILLPPQCWCHSSSGTQRGHVAS